MIRALPPPWLLVLVASTGLLCAEEPRLIAPRFLGGQSCQSSSCHGGGVGKDQAIIWEKKDVHARAHTILANARSKQIADGLKIEDATKSARCTVCHSPLQAVPIERFVKDARPDNGVSCETCHGPAEPWLRFHTRLDITHEQRVAAGLRELTDFYGRANACVACHLNIDTELVRAGHPEMFFELDGQVAAQPPHYKDAGAWLGPRAWLTGQAATLRELSWKLTKTNDPELLLRWKGLAWVLAKASPAGANIADSADFASAQTAADALARDAAKSEWSKERTVKLLREYCGVSAQFRESEIDAAELRRRAEMLVLAIDRLWSALKREGSITSDAFDTALRVLNDQARAQAAFERIRFAAALEQLEVALARIE